MMRTLLVAAGLTLVLASDLAGHGGYYRGPGPSIAPPGAGGGVRSGGGVGPVTPGGGAGPVTPAGGGAAAFTAARKNVAQDYTDWETWWTFNKHPYLNLRARLGSRFAVTGLGREGTGDQLEAGGTVRPLFVEMEAAVLPVLRGLLAADDPDIADSAVLALARITPLEHADSVFEDVKQTLGHNDRSVQQSAILALGVLGHPAAVPLLQEILYDTKEGRRLLRTKQEVDEIQRSMAAVALGYISDVQAIPGLKQLFEKEKDSKIDLKASCLLGLGLFQDGQHEIVPFLLERLGDRRMTEVVRAQIPIALARLGETARPTLPVLLKMTESRKTENLVCQSCIIALGRLAAPEDAEIIATLQDLAVKASDQACSNFAFIALGEIGARAAADCERNREMLGELDRFLLRKLTRPRKKSQLPWAATACALVGRAYPDGADARGAYSEKLAAAWKGTRNPVHRGALTIALGLVENRSMGPELLKTLRESGDRRVNGYLAEALGLMRYDAALDEMKRLLKDDNDSRYRVQLATGLGLMGDLEVSRLLVEELEKAKTLWVTSSVAKAIGNVGDRSAVPPLVDLAEDRRRPGLARAFAAVALGLVGEKLPLPWNSRVSVGSNYIAAFYTQTEIMDIL